VAPGLWIWRREYPDWRPGVGWEEVVTSTVVESGDEVALLDPLAPPDDATEVWEWLDAGRRPSWSSSSRTHVRDVDVFVRRYGARAFGPWLRGALRRTRPRRDTALAARAARALVFADALTAPGGELRVWATPWHDERVVPALRALLELPSST
jgi:hypothetical protein